MVLPNPLVAIGEVVRARAPCPFAVSCPARADAGADIGEGALSRNLDGAIM